ncbi:hypothetical protein O1M63_55560 [Streptomyces mirabilis]|nr:hypothetical protein [Streptomyces mirabilis]
MPAAITAHRASTRASNGWSGTARPTASSPATAPVTSMGTRAGAREACREQSRDDRYEEDQQRDVRRLPAEDAPTAQASAVAYVRAATGARRERPDTAANSTVSAARTPRVVPSAARRAREAHRADKGREEEDRARLRRAGDVRQRRHDRES